MRSGRRLVVGAALGAGAMLGAAATALGAPGVPGDVRPASDFVREPPCATSRLRFCLADPPLPVAWEAAAFTTGSTARRYLVEPVVDVDSSVTDAVVVDDPSSTGAAVDVTNGHRYWLRVYASESVGGTTEIGGAVERDFRVDETPPSAAVTIAGGAAFTRTREVTADVPAADPPTAGAFPASGLGGVAVWSGAQPSLDAAARSYAPAVPVTLPEGPDGPRSVSAVVFDRARHPLSRPLRILPIDLRLFPEVPQVRLPIDVRVNPIPLPTRPFTPVLTPRAPLVRLAGPGGAVALAIPALTPRIEGISPLVTEGEAPEPPSVAAPSNGNRSPVATDAIVLDTTPPAPDVSVTPPASPAGLPVALSAAASADATSGVAPAGIVWTLGDGATARGPRVARAYRTPGTYDGSVAVPDNAGNVATAGFRVRVSAPLDTDGRPGGGAGAARTTAVRPRLSVRTSIGTGLSDTHARLAGSWRESALRGRIVVSGRALRALRLTATLRPRGGQGAVRRLSRGLAVPRGPVERTLRLPPGLLPGSYDLEIASPAGPPLRRVLSLRIPAPKEGVASAATVALSPTGAPVGALRPGTRRMFARFRLAVLPAGARRLSVTWFHPDGRAVGTALKPRRARVVSFVRSSAALPRGTWRAVLSAGGVRVATATARVR